MCVEIARIKMKKPMIEYKYKKRENKFTENGHTMFEFDVLQRLKRLAYLEEQIKQGQLFIQLVSNRTSVDFKKLRDAYFKEHVTHKTTDGIPIVCTHPHNLFEWFKAELKEYGC